MRKLKLHSTVFLSVAILGAVSFFAVLVLKPNCWQQLAFAALTVAIGTVLLFVIECKNIKIARLIIENQIIHIQPVAFSEKDNSIIKEKNKKSVDVIISCFGILFDNRIIKFNQGGVRLKEVKLVRGYLAFYYGTEKKTKNITLISGVITSGELDEIIEKFRYETGVIPQVLSN